MATETLIATAVGPTDGWTNSGGANKVASVAAPDDGDTSYVTNGTSNLAQQDFVISDPALIGASDTINSVTVRLNLKKSAGSTTANLTVNTASLGSTAGVSITGIANTTYADLDYVFSTAPDGAAWTLAKLNDLQTQLIQTKALSGVRVTTLTVLVDYTPAPTGPPAGTLMLMGAGK